MKYSSNGSATLKSKAKRLSAITRTDVEVPFDFIFSDIHIY